MSMHQWMRFDILALQVRRYGGDEQKHSFSRQQK